MTTLREKLERALKTKQLHGEAESVCMRFKGWIPWDFVHKPQYETETAFIEDTLKRCDEYANQNAALERALIAVAEAAQFALKTLSTGNAPFLQKQLDMEFELRRKLVTTLSELNLVLEAKGLSDE